jgi:hypothetical protein
MECDGCKYRYRLANQRSHRLAIDQLSQGTWREQNIGLTLARCVAGELRCAIVFAWQAPDNPQTLRIDHDAGARMSTIEMVVFCLAVIWTPDLAFVGYLLLPKPPGSD